MKHIKDFYYDCYYDNPDYYEECHRKKSSFTYVDLGVWVAVVLSILIISVLFSCNETATPKLQKFTVYYNNDSVNCDIKDSVVAGFMPAFIDRSSIQVKAGFSDTSYAGTMDLREPAAMVFGGKLYKVIVQTFNKLPILSINTNDVTIATRETYVTGILTIDGNTDSIRMYDMQIKGRGNSTWFQPKKPYKIKLKDKALILGMPADKEYALLANYLDKTLLRNDVALELSTRLGIAWTPRRTPVDVFINGQYNGNYLLCETNKVGKDRLNINPMDVKKPEDTTGDYQVEADLRHDGIQWFTTGQNIAFVIKAPDSVSAQQFEYIKNKISLTENHIANYKDIRSEVDLDSWIKWMIVNELMRNSDAPLVSSCFWYKSNGKLFMGPVWDFDASSGSYTGNDAEGWYVNEGYWFGGLFKYHPYYKARFKEIWNQYKDSLASINNYIGKRAEQINLSQAENYRRWDNLLSPVRGDQIIGGSYAAEVTILQNFLSKRFLWMDKEISQF